MNAHICTEAAMVIVPYASLSRVTNIECLFIAVGVGKYMGTKNKIVNAKIVTTCCLFAAFPRKSYQFKSSNFEPCHFATEKKI